MIYSYYTSHVTMNNDRIVGGEYSWYLYGTSSSTTIGFNTCTNNRFISCGLYSIYSLYDIGNTFTNNVWDSGAYTYGYYSILSEYETGVTITNNQVYGIWYYGMELVEENYYTAKINNIEPTVTVANNIITGTTDYGCIWEPISAVGLCVFAHNTIYAKNTIYGMEAYIENNGVGTQIFSSNLIIANSPTTYGIYLYITGSAGQFSSQYGPGFGLNGNDIYVTNSVPLAYVYNTSGYVTCSNLAAYQTCMQGALLNAAFETYATSAMPPFLNSAKNNFFLEIGRAS